MTMRPTGLRLNANRLAQGRYAEDRLLLVTQSGSFIDVPNTPFYKTYRKSGLSNYMSAHWGRLHQLTSVISNMPTSAPLFSSTGPCTRSRRLLSQNMYTCDQQSRILGGSPLTAEEEMCYSLDGVADHHGGGCCIVSGCLV